MQNIKNLKEKNLKIYGSVSELIIEIILCNLYILREMTP